MKRLKEKLLGLRRRDDGASAVEYGLLVALIAVVIAVAVGVLGLNLQNKFNEVANCVGESSSSACEGSGGDGGDDGGDEGGDEGGGEEG